MVDILALLQPIRPDAPAGQDLRSVDNTIGEVRELRRRDNPLVPNPKEADYKSAAKVASAALSGKTKDLELGAYLCESWTRLDGMSGLQAGLELMSGLVSQFWQHVHPGIEIEGGKPVIFHALRGKWLSWIGSAVEFLDAVKAVPLTTGDAPLRLLDYQLAMRMEEAQRVNQTQYDEMVAAGTTTPERWNMAWGTTDPDHQRALAESCTQCLGLVDRLQQASDELLGGTGVSVNLIPLRELLEVVAHLSAVGGGAAAEGEVAAAPAAGGGGASAAGATAGPAAGPLRSRPDAVRMLKEVGSFLRKTEPHSPVSYLVDRCVRWLNMGFEEVMQDLVKTEDGLARMRETLGLERQNTEGS